jgi:glycosyltransferase involved in cell wall biosynthesis
MNLLLVNHYRRFKNWRWGRSFALSRELVRLGHSVALCIIADREKLRLRSYEHAGVQIFEFPDLTFGRLRSGWDPWCTLRRIRTFKSFGPAFDLIHCFETRPASIYPVLAYRKRYPVPLVIDWNDWWGRGGLISENRPVWYSRTLGHIETYYEEAFRHHGNVHTVVSDALRQRLFGLGVARESVFLIPNGSDTDYFKPRDQSRARHALGIADGIPVLCFTGFDVLGDLSLVLSAFKIICRHHPDAKLLLTGRKTKQTRRFSETNKLTENILQLGYVDENSLLNVIASSDICLMPFRNRISNIGRHPGKVSEYLSMGKPVVSNPVGEIGRMFSSNGIGVLSDETPEAFSGTVLELLKNPDQRAQIGRAARLYAESILSWKVIVDRQLKKVYEYVSGKWGKGEAFSSAHQVPAF